MNPAKKNIKKQFVIEVLNQDALNSRIEPHDSEWVQWKKSLDNLLVATRVHSKPALITGKPSSSTSYPKLVHSTPHSRTSSTSTTPKRKLSASSSMDSVYEIAAESLTRANTVLDEIWLHIFSFLDSQSLACLTLVNRHFHSLLNDNYLWKVLCRRKRFQPVSKWKSRRSEKSRRPSTLISSLKRQSSSTALKSLAAYTSHLHKKQVVYRLLDCAWKQVYRDCVLTDLNWKSGRCKVQLVSDTLHKGKLCVSFNEDKAVSVSMEPDGKVWDIKTGDCLLHLRGHQATITTVQVHDPFIITGSVDCDLRVFDGSSGDCLCTLQGHQGEIVTVQWREGQIASGSEDCTVRLWTRQSSRQWSCDSILRGHQGAVTCLHLLQGQLISGSVDGTLRVWNLETRDCMAVLRYHQGTVFCVQYHHHYIISGGQDKRIVVWDTTSSPIQHVKILEGPSGHHAAVVCLQCDDTKLVSGGADHVIKVWNITTGLCLYTLQHHTAPIWDLKLTPTKIISSSFDHSLLIWDFAYFAAEQESQES